MAPDPSITRVKLDRTNAAMLALTSLFVVARISVRVSKRKPFELHDFFIYLAFVLYVCMWIMFLKENDPLFKATAAEQGKIPFYPEIVHDAAMIFRYMTAAQLLFYGSLLSVKVSLLVLYRRLLDRTPTMFTIMWWGILTFCVLSYIGAAMTTIFVCDSHSAKYNQGQCHTPREVHRSIVSLWFAYGVDIVTDLAVMFLPFRMTWNLQMPKLEKLGVFVLFGTGWVCILFSTLRVVQVGLKNGVPKTPDPKWLEMWTIIETTVAVIIGCSPAFAALIRSRFQTQVSYDSQGYVKRNTNDIKMQSGGSGGSRSTGQKKRNSDMLWTQDHESEEELAGDGITVTTTIRQEDRMERSSTRSGR